MSVTIIDGRSGSGKTSFAARLAAENGAQVLHLEDLYPGWGGLAVGSLAVADVLDRREYRRYDWHLGAFDEARIALDPSRRLIIEGCGSLTKRNLDASRRWLERAELPETGAAGAAAGGAASVRSIWLECPEPVRRERALARDGDTFAPHWQRWAEHEDAHLARHRPWLLADEVIDAG